MIIKTKIISIVALFFLMQACVNAGQDNAADSQSLKIINSAQQATRKYKLAAIPEYCLIYIISKNKYKGLPLVVVRERHGGNCGGDPGTSPRLFSIAVDEASGAVWTDARSLVGQMEELSK